MEHKDSEYQHLMPLFDKLADPSVSDEDRRHARDELVTGHLPLAAHIARRFAHRGQPVEDLEQVARLGLIHAVDRFDPSLGHTFLAFAIPTVTGEIRRYFRDHTWTVSVPRKLRDRHLAITATVEQLTQELGRAPRPRQIAERLGIAVADVYEGVQAGLAYRPDSLDRTERDDDHAPATVTSLAEVDTGLELVDNRETLYQALSLLPARDSHIVIMRFYNDMTQTQIAECLGISQMQVSRRLSSILERLRRSFAGSVPATGCA
ncbi:MAG TPA: SigB/SigF/SigG family RNA polymerase sigma factor [Pseudonocardiaceae bacterium]|nr:SigB/SigF/SigG family RNA polymerase sigma factor [Pseudonocardiaceae bacterium]